MSWIRHHGKGLFVSALIVIFTVFAALALARYQMFTQYAFLALLPAAVLIPFSAWLLRKKRPEHFVFLFVFLLCGLLYLFAVPMLQVSDEPQHYLRSYEIASFQSPKSISENDVGDVMDGNLIPKQFVDFSATNYAQLSAMLPEQIDKTHPEAYSFPGSALYSPFTYVPQALGIFIAKLFSSHSLIVLYAGRLSNLLVVAILAMLCVKLFPFEKRLVMLLLLVPIYVHKAGSMSADGLTLAVVMLFLSYVLHLQYATNGTLKARQILPLYLLVFFLSQCKIVYLPVCLFFFVLSQERFGSKKRYFLHLAGLVLLAVGAGVGWLMISSRYLSVGYTESGKQIASVISDPLGYVRVLLRTVKEQGKILIEQMMGIGMGVGGVRNSRLLTLSYLVVLVLCAVFTKRGTCPIRQSRDAFLALICAFCVAMLTFAALYVQWTTPGNRVIMGLQGRYFLPVLYLCCIAVLQFSPLEKIRRPLSFEVPLVYAVGVNLVAAVSCLGYGLSI